MSQYWKSGGSALEIRFEGVGIQYCVNFLFNFFGNFFHEQWSHIRWNGEPYLTSLHQPAVRMVCVYRKDKETILPQLFSISQLLLMKDECCSEKKNSYLSFTTAV